MDTLSDDCVFQVAPTQEIAAAPLVSNSAKDQQPHHLSFAASRTFNKLVTEGVPFAEARQKAEQANVSTIQSKRPHTEETAPTDTAKRAKTGSLSESAGAEMNQGKRRDMKVGVVASKLNPFLK